MGLFDLGGMDLTGAMIGRRREMADAPDRGLVAGEPAPGSFTDMASPVSMVRDATKDIGSFTSMQSPTGTLMNPMSPARRMLMRRGFLPSRGITGRR